MTLANAPDRLRLQQVTLVTVSCSFSFARKFSEEVINTVSLPVPAGIDFQTGAKVTGVDVKGKTVSTDAGKQISFEKLIIALGSVVWLLIPRLHCYGHSSQDSQTST